ncbi:MAG: RpiB/LacA/LacB family sugar-phosphate isomerase [Candidatus Nomurabacteria bacterium]|nr:RpiB/LacA/LacB family sugar-phosphate isomerase [Candidatus Nomurabacteria bacterium]
MKIYIGSDHAGYELKEKLKEYLSGLGLDYEVIDKGAFSLNKDDDYPDFIRPVAEAVAKEKGSFGIILGGSGEGEAMDANRIDGVRACEYYGSNLDIVKVCREHNDANIISIGVRFATEDEIKFAIELFLNTKFSGDERHIRRIEKLDTDK